MVGRTLPPPRRAGFTLVELLVVMGIIAVLAGLLLVAVGRVGQAGKRATASNDVQQLSIALTNFKRDFGFYPPTTFVVPSMVDDTDPNYQILIQMFGKFTPTAAAPPPPTIPMPNGTALPFVVPMAPDMAAYTLDQAENLLDRHPIPTGTGTRWWTLWANYCRPSAGVTRPLDSNQCLTFFLGGPGGQGWNPSKPWKGSAPAPTKTYYDLPANKLRQLGVTTPTTPISPPFSYIDPWGTPYAYLLSGQTAVDPIPGSDTVMNRTGASSVRVDNKALPLPLMTSPPTNFTIESTPAPASTDPNLFRVVAYVDALTKPVNQGGVQIICAGPDQTFGPGGSAWSPGMGQYIESLRFGGYDDVANFNGGTQLGVKK